MDGGHQEGAMRGGTENVAGIVAMAAAAREACENMTSDAVRIAALRDELECRILAEIANTRVNGAAPRVPGTLNVSFMGIDSASLVELLDERGVCAAAEAPARARKASPRTYLLRWGCRSNVPRAPCVSRSRMKRLKTILTTRLAY